MHPETIHQMLDTLSTARVEAAGLQEAMLAAMFRNLAPDDAARLQGIVTEFREREATLKTEIATQEAAIKELVLATGATASGTYLQALIVAPRVTYYWH